MYSVNTFNGQIFKDGILIPIDIDNQNYIEYKNHIDASRVVNYFESSTPEELQSLNINKQISDEFKAYEKRREDGIKAYNQINAEFRVLKVNGVIDQAYYDSISEQLEGVVFQITNGQWKSGLQKLESLGSLQIGQQLYDRLHLQITNYITLSYL